MRATRRPRPAQRDGTADPDDHTRMEADRTAAPVGEADASRRPRAALRTRARLRPHRPAPARRHRRGADRPRRPRERHRVRHDRRDHRPGLRSPPPGGWPPAGRSSPASSAATRQILDWGRTKRLFTPTQRLALTERDGGCAMCGAPPGHTKVHHIRWWARDAGPTDLNNGVLSANPATTASTTTGGTSASTAPGSERRSGSSRHPTSTPPAHPDSADAHATTTPPESTTAPLDSYDYAA